MIDAIDPRGANALISAVLWVQSTLLGTIATAFAIIAISAVGFLMLTGRTDLSRAAKRVFGCFIIFSASTIAHGIIGFSSGPTPILDPIAAAPPPLPRSRPNSNANATPYDPYAGAAISPR